MPIDVEALGIDRLSVRERLDLIERIWNVLPEQVEPGEVPEWHLAELARRRAEARQRPGEGRPGGTYWARSAASREPGEAAQMRKRYTTRSDSRAVERLGGDGLRSKLAV